MTHSPSCKLKIMNLNLWNYNHFKQRKPKIIAFIKKHNPDIVVFEEVRDDLAINKEGRNQLIQLNEELNYKYEFFAPTSDRLKERPHKHKLKCFEGQGVLSNVEVIDCKTVKLKKHKTNRYHKGFIHVTLKTGSKKVDILGVHFTPDDIHSELDLIETLKYSEDNYLKPIIVGDFNIIKVDILHKHSLDKYKSSYKLKPYISFPSEKITLDYILIPKDGFKFITFNCIDEKLSDHTALISEIEIK